MRLDLATDFAVTDTPRQLPHTPRYSLSGAYVVASPHRDQPSHEVLLSETYGSVDWLWSGDDEFRFDNNDRTLRGIMLSVPEEEPSAGWNPRDWTVFPPVPRGLAALSRANFAAGPTSVRWVSESGDHLICAHEDSLAPVNDMRRLRVAPHLDLVFADHVYAGWILSHPADHLVREWEPTPSMPAPDGTASVLRDYLTTVVEPKIDRMRDGDPALLQELHSLLARSTALPDDPRCEVLRDQLTDLRDNWYGDI
ncbi:hypothetical protein [Streptomyces sp. YS-3]|uniref:hypothetical protein n=1 Tax=Streptomyces sp. YS-3 TaxID=3381352 RepID=UPI003862B36A